MRARIVTAVLLMLVMAAAPAGAVPPGNVFGEMYMQDGTLFVQPNASGEFVSAAVHRSFIPVGSVVLEAVTTVDTEAWVQVEGVRDTEDGSRVIVSRHRFPVVAGTDRYIVRDRVKGDQVRVVLRVEQGALEVRGVEVVDAPVSSRKFWRPFVPAFAGIIAGILVIAVFGLYRGRWRDT